MGGLPKMDNCMCYPHGSAKKFLAKSAVAASQCKSEHYYVCESMQRHNEERTPDFSVPKLLLSCDWNWALGCDAGQPDLKGYTALGLKVQDNKCEVKKAFAEDSSIGPAWEIRDHDNGLLHFGIHDSGEGSLNDVVIVIGAENISPQHGAQMRYRALSDMDAEAENISEKGIGGDINAVRGKHSKDKPSILCIQETKLVNISSHRCYVLWGSTEIGWVHRGVDKEDRGILTMWSKHTIKCLSIEEGKGFVVTKGEFNIGGTGQKVSLAFMNVYSSCHISNKYTM